VATKTTRVCDHYQTTRDVKTIHVLVQEVDPERDCEEVGVALIDAQKDLCPKAVERLVKMVNRGLRPPGVGGAAEE